MFYHTHRRCPFCDQSMRAEAALCPECGSEVTPVRRLNVARLLLTAWVLVLIVVGARQLETHGWEVLGIRRTVSVDASTAVLEAGATAGPSRPGWLRLVPQFVLRRVAPEYVEGVNVEGGPASTPAISGVFLDLAAIGGKPPDEVAAELGSPSSVLEEQTYEGRPLPTLSYRGDQVQVSYRAGRAEWIFIQRLDALPFDASALGAFGLSDSPPVVRTPNMLRWENVHGFAEIDMFAMPQGGVDHVLAHFALTGS